MPAAPPESQLLYEQIGPSSTFGRESASARLFPNGSQSNVDLNSQASVRRMSDIFTPRPFGSNRNLAGVRSVKAFSSSSSLDKTSDSGDRGSREHSIEPARAHIHKAAPANHAGRATSVATVRPVLSSQQAPSLLAQDYNADVGVHRSQDLRASQVRAGQDDPWSPYAYKRIGKDSADVAAKRREARKRSLTISSSQPLKYTERTPSPQKAKIHSAAGDLISSVSCHCSVILPLIFISYS